MWRILTNLSEYNYPIYEGEQNAVNNNKAILRELLSNNLFFFFSDFPTQWQLRSAIKKLERFFLSRNGYKNFIFARNEGLLQYLLPTTARFLNGYVAEYADESLMKLPKIDFNLEERRKNKS